MRFKKLFNFRGTSMAAVIRTRLLFSMLIVGSMFGRLAAQEYQADPIDKEAGRNKAFAQKCVKDPATYASDPEKFKKYFENYYFPAMTQTEPEKLGELGKLREDLFK